jgi:hypothetical protein
VAIKNGQSRETGNIGYKRHRTKTNDTKNITQKNKNELHQNSGVNPGHGEGKQFLPLIRHGKPHYNTELR